MKFHELLKVKGVIQKVVTTVPLGGNAVFTSDSFKTQGYTKITGYVAADADSATDGLSIQQTDDDDWSISSKILKSNFTVRSGVPLGFVVDVVAKYGRIQYVNSGVAQTSSKLVAYLRW